MAYHMTRTTDSLRILDETVIYAVKITGRGGPTKWLSGFKKDQQINYKLCVEVWSVFDDADGVIQYERPHKNPGTCHHHLYKVLRNMHILPH